MSIIVTKLFSAAQKIIETGQDLTELKSDVRCRMF